VKYLTDELLRRGHEVHILQSLDAYNIKRRTLPDKPNKDVNSFYIKSAMNVSAYSAYLLGRSKVVTNEFNRLIKEIHPEVVHHHNISLLGYNLLPKRSTYTNIYTAHDYWLVCQQNSLLRNSEICRKKSCFLCPLTNQKFPQLWRGLPSFKEAFSSLDFLIAPCTFMKNILAEKIPVPIKVLRNFAPLPPHKIRPSGFNNFFLYSGVLEPHKGVLDLVKLFRDEKITANLLITGRGSISKTIASFIHNYKLEHKVKLLGWVDNERLFQLLGDANALVLPSMWPENSPLITIEAMSVGTPVIASDMGGLPEIVNQIDINLIFKNLKELHSILRSYSKKYRSSMIKDVYRKNFSPDAYLSQYISALRD
jgi:glycosyltransferase involved in cell wall biosynthesis